jgi:hypothetical protein
MSKDSNQYYHDKGEQDRSNGDYDPPHGVIDHFTTWSTSGNERLADENKSYNDGWHNTDDQINGKK